MHQRNYARPSSASSQIYTYNLPYGCRREICNLLDADQSWRLLAGKIMALDATQITLIGQAYLRNSSPTEELLNRLDSANVRICELAEYLAQINHCRAMEIIKPFAQGPTQTGTEYNQSNYQGYSKQTPFTLDNEDMITTLDTPTPSFSEQQPGNYMALMGQEFETEPFTNTNDQQHQRYQDQMNWPPTVANKCEDLNHKQVQPIATCHRTSAESNARQIQPKPSIHDDPGEEIIRLACASNRKRTSISDQEVVNQLRLIMQINYNELKLASNDFADTNILGNGGFASVYRGNWKGTDVAIKKLKCNLMDQALNELTILNSYRIDNILPIYGISIDGPVACLVYQFMSNGSLEDRLSCKKGTPPLTWAQRALIAEGVAKGLYYLHTLRDKPLVHGDAKSANVLLDSQFNPKLGDFGLARQVFRSKNPQTESFTHCTVSSIHGTSVYLPPEYLRHKILSPAVDVYSYGIVLLEMATGRRAYDGKRLLIDMVEDEMQSASSGQVSYRLKDSRLFNETQNDLKIWFQLLLKSGLDCAHKIKKKRPDMGQVLNKFATFRTNILMSDQSSNNHNLNLLDANSISTGSSRTMRTLTPEFGGLTAQSSQGVTSNGTRVDFYQNGHQPERLSPAVRLNNQTAVATNSALMSVEEESEPNQLPQYDNNQIQADGYKQGINDNQSENNGFNDNNSTGASFEAMIPLLTELGVKQE